MSPHHPHETDEAQAHAEFFATHGFADIGAPLNHPHGSASGHGHGGLGSFRRAAHGSVRAILLWALAEKPMHGYQIMTELEQRSGGFWKLSPGSVYPTLQQLADEGLLTTGGEQTRRVYALTDAGRAVAETIRDGHGQTPWVAAKGVGEQRFRLWRAASEVAKLTREAALNGSEEQADQVLDLLGEVSARIHTLLTANSSEA